ncbi:hypothetical protein FRC08_003130 [Ceratobasidium sp. 394]|nr:hypothetical protein FRC08_003130 [Ceratobasidium sp. 394]
MRKDVLGEQAAKVAEIEEDPSRELSVRTLTWFVTEVLRRSRTSINMLQVVLAYLAEVKFGLGVVDEIRLTEVLS